MFLRLKRAGTRIAIGTALGYGAGVAAASEAARQTENYSADVFASMHAMMGAFLGCSVGFLWAFHNENNSFRSEVYRIGDVIDRELDNNVEDDNEDDNEDESEHKADAKDDYVHPGLKRLQAIGFPEENIPLEFQDRFISYELFDEPVVLIGDGETYERRALERWLEENEKSPAHGTALTHEQCKFVINQDKKRLIEAWIAKQEAAYKAKMPLANDVKTESPKQPLEPLSSALQRRRSF